MDRRIEAAKIRNAVLLAVAALIWGIAFVAQSVAMDYIGPFTYNGIRSLIGGIVLIPVILISDANKKKRGEYVKLGKKEKKNLIVGGVLCGICICVASNLQQAGIVGTDAGKAGFITALYIVIVPILGIFFKKKVSPVIWACVAVATAGMYFLCVSDKMSLSSSDLLVLMCAVAFSIHILVIDHYSPLADGVKLSCIQFFVCGIITSILMFIFEKPDINAILSAYIPILYAGVLSCGVAYTLQIVGQKGLNPTVASLILSVESVFSVFAGWIILGQTLTGREIFGCALMFAAIIFAQLPIGKKKK